jgi:integrase
VAAKFSSQGLTQGSERLTVNPLSTSIDSNKGWLVEHFATSPRVLTRNILPSTPQSPAEIKRQLDAHPRVAGVLQSDSPVGNVPSATPRKRRRGKSMSRRRGQNGYIERSGNWWVVRFRKDVPDREDRTYVRVKICPISGPGSLTASERKRKAKEIIAASGADTQEYFEKVVVGSSRTTFREQAKQWLEHMRTRKRKPVASATLDAWEDCLRNWLNPALGDIPLETVNNLAVKHLVARMVASGKLGPKSINNYVQVVKMVVASAVNEDGEQIHTRKWNHEFIDLPIVDKSKQNAPSISAEVMAGLAAWNSKRERMLFILCAAAGLRICEALGLEIDKHMSEDRLTLFIRQKARGSRIEKRLKTGYSERAIDLHPSIAALLKEYMGDRKAGLLFCTRDNKPLPQSNIVRRHLHKALKQVHYINPFTGTHKAGNHIFRRFRNTYLRNHTDCPEGLIKFWMGHAPEDMSDRYDKIKEDVTFRKHVAERIGIGFELPPSIAPIAPKLSEEVAIVSAA